MIRASIPTPIRLAAVLAIQMGAAPPLVRAQEPTVTPAASTEVEVPPATPVSGRGAFLRSLVLPGWGQAYVGAPGRGAVYFAMEAGSAWMVYKTLRQLEEARDAQSWLHETARLAEDEKTGLVESREAQLEDWLAISIFLLLFSGADAYVTAQLADFEEHVGVRPAPDGGGRLEVRFPVGRPRQ